MIFLLQEVVGALHTAQVETQGMISNWGAPCLSYCKVKLIYTLTLPATYTITTRLACHPPCDTACRQCHHMLQQLQHSMLYIGAECPNCFMCLSDRSSGANQGACPPSAAHVCQAALVQSPPLPWSQPLVNATVMEHNESAAQHIRCQVSFCWQW